MIENDQEGQVREQEDACKVYLTFYIMALKKGVYRTRRPNQFSWRV